MPSPNKLTESSCWRAGACKVSLVARLLKNGRPDDTFGTDGFATDAFDDGNGSASAVIQQADGKLVVAGSVDSPNGNLDIALARFDSDGVLDSTFGDSGLVTLQY